jgi:hypothetical protein
LSVAFGKVRTKAIVSPGRLNARLHDATNHIINKPLEKEEYFTDGITAEIIRISLPNY